MACALSAEHAAYQPATPPVPDSAAVSAATAATVADTSDGSWTRIQCDGGCNQGIEHKVKLTGAGFTLARGKFSFVSHRCTCSRVKDQPDTCTCYTDNKAGASENVYLRKALYITDDGTNNESEFAAVYHSLLQATGDQLQYLDIHTDSELVVNCVTGHCELTEPTLRPYLHAICQLLSRTTAWRISHIHREANSEADALATIGKTLSHSPAPRPPLPSHELLESATYRHPHLHMHKYDGQFRSARSFLRSLTDPGLSSAPLHDLETDSAFDHLACDTAPGPEGHHPAVYKRGGAPMRRIFAALFRKCWRMGRTPEQWKESHLRMLFKSGDTSDVSNYRGISLLAVASKLYERVLYNRLEELLVHRGRMPAELFGFISKHSQTHALYSAYEAIKHNRRAGKCVCVCSADVKKAYPSMNRAQMLNDLKGLGVSEGLYHAIASMYQHNKSKILTSTPGETSSSYEVHNGLREGAVLSPLLYCIFTAGLIAKLKAPANAALGLHVGREWAGAQLWADDLVLMTAHEDAAVAKDQMRKLMHVLLADASEKHYSYSEAKTKVLVMDGTPSALDRKGAHVPSLPLAEWQWPLGVEVASFKFLGTVLHRQLRWDEHLAYRESQAQDAMYHVRQLASHKALHPKYATREWERTCGQSIFYGAEALGLHTAKSWDCLNKHVARGAALALGLHHTVTGGVARAEAGAHGMASGTQIWPLVFKGGKW